MSDALGGLRPETLERLKGVSVATLTTQLFKRGLRNICLQGVRRLTRTAPNMVGPAFTLRYIPAREDLDHIGVFEDVEHPQRKAVETVPPGHVLVCDCREDASVGSGGSILVSRLEMRGAAGFVTDGGLRDTPEIAGYALPVYIKAAAPPLNLVKHHAVDINVPIGCGGVPVFPDDIIVGDGEGVAVIPAHLADEVAADAAEQERYERFAIREVRRGRTIVGLYPAREEARRDYEAWLAAGEPEA